jgi:hypothetical protein
MLGVGMAGLLHFQAPVPTYQSDTLSIVTHLENTVTDEVRDAVKQGYAFQVEYSFSLIVNQRKSFQSSAVNSLTYDSLWRVNGLALTANSLQAPMGFATAHFSRLHFDPSDEVLIFVKAKIVADSTFTQSTGLPTTILWNYFVPRTETHWNFSAGGFHLQ